MNVTQDVLKKRAHLLNEIRCFFASRDVLEVETPLLGRSGSTDPHLHNLKTKISNQDFYLQTSPESAMKRLLASGTGSIYQICKAFRNDEQGSLHNTEFTMVEWYRVGFDYQQLMDEVESLIRQLIGISAIQRVTYRDAFLQTVKIDTDRASYEELKSVTGSVSGQTSKNDLLDLILVEKILPQIGDAVYIYDYPSDQAAMAKINGETAERFELIINGIEIANGYTELTDPIEQEQRFRQENEQRARMGLETIPLDQKLVDALTKGIPECAGVAMGFDRLVMLACHESRLSEIMPFPVELL